MPCSSPLKKKPSRQPESLLKRQILTYLAYQREYLVIPVQTTGTYNAARKVFYKKQDNTPNTFYRGVSDLLLLHRVYGLIALEVKTKTGTASKEQREFIEKVNGLGHHGFIVRSLEDVIKALRSLQIGLRVEARLPVP